MTQAQMVISHKVSRSMVELQDRYYNLDVISFIHNDTTMFRTEKESWQPYEQYAETVMALRVELSLDKRSYELTIYTVLDLLADVGGLGSALFTICAVFMARWNKNKMETFLQDQLYEGPIVEPKG